jgi:hypothetical protein
MSPSISQLITVRGVYRMGTVINRPIHLQVLSSQAADQYKYADPEISQLIRL